MASDAPPGPVVIHRRQLEPKPAPAPKAPAPAPAPSAPSSEPPIPGRIEVTIKINQFPTGVETVENGWKRFTIDCGPGRHVTVKVRPKIWANLENARANWPEWVAAITGKVGTNTHRGFCLDEPAIQVFERKAKPAPASAAPDGSPAQGQ